MRGAVATMESLMGGVTQLVAQGLAGFQDKLHQQEALCLQNRDTLLELQVRTVASVRLAISLITYLKY